MFGEEFVVFGTDVHFRPYRIVGIGNLYPPLVRIMTKIAHLKIGGRVTNFPDFRQWIQLYFYHRRLNCRPKMNKGRYRRGETFRPQGVQMGIQFKD